MQSGLSAADRKLMIGAGLVALVLIAGTATFAPVAGPKGSEAPSSYSSSPGGARAAYLLLLDLGYHVRRWSDSPAALTDEAPNATLIIAEPTEMPIEHERRAIVEFVRRGGQLLFCGGVLGAFFQQAKMTPVGFQLEPEQFAADFPGYLTRGAPRVEILPQAYWSELRPSQLGVYGAAGSTAVVAWRIGDGRVIWWAGATPLTNAGITRAGNLNLFLNSVSPAGESRTIYWDEHFHGDRGSLWSYFEKTPVIWGVVQIVVLFLALVFTFSRRSGPVAAPVTVSRLSPLEFVDTMGGLYQRAGARSIAVGVSYRHLRLELTRRLGLAAATPDADLAKAAVERMGFEAEIGATLAEAANAGANPPRAAEAVTLVQRLAMFAAKLAPRPQKRT